MSQGSVHPFIFEHLDIRGAVVHLGAAWQSMQAGRNYPEPVAGLLGEMAVVTALIASQMKQEGRVTFQLRGKGPIQMLVMDGNEQLQLRGMARCQPVVLPAPAPVLLGAQQGGHLVFTLDQPTARQPYQSYVPLQGNSTAEIFEHYLSQSDQLPSRLFLSAGDQAAAGLFLQKLPDADQRDPDGWNRIVHLAETVKAEELRLLDAPTLLTRLFHDELSDADKPGTAHGLRLYEVRPVTHHCPENRAKIADMIRGIGQADAETLLAEHGEIVINDDICNREYRFSPEEVAALFAEQTPLH